MTTGEGGVETYQEVRENWRLNVSVCLIYILNKVCILLRVDYNEIILDE